MFDIVRKLYNLFDARERRNAILLIVMVFVMGAMESISIASVMPFLSVAANPGIIHKSKPLLALYNAFSFTDVYHFLLFLGVAIVLVVLSGLAIKGATYWALARFIFMRNHALSHRLLESYLARPYGFFLNRHSGELGKAILDEVNQLTMMVLQPAGLLVGNLSTVVFLLVLLIWVNPIAAAVAVALIGGSYTAVYFLVRKQMARIGHERVQANEERFRIAQEAFGGIKEVKTGGLENEFARRFREPSLRINRFLVSNAVAGELPRYVIEAVTNALVFGIILVELMVEGGDLRSVIPTLGVYAFAGMRLLPALQQIYRAAVKLRFGKPALDALYEEFQDVQPESVEKTTSLETLRLTREIEFADVDYVYPSADRPTLQGVSLAIPAHATVGFVGMTGAGKTTMVDMILGLLEPARGEVTVDGKPVFPSNIRAWQRNLGYVPQHIFLADDSVAANIAFGVPESEIDINAVIRAAKLAELHGFVVSQLADGYQTEVGERGIRLSGGQIQRLGIARALYHDPDVLILDEATSALDNRTERIVMQGILKLGSSKTVILIAHRLSTVEKCDVIFVFEHGRLVGRGTYGDLLESSETFRTIAETAKININYG